MGGTRGTKEEEEKNAYRILVEKLEGKKQLGTPRHKWEVNI
jgi:hypothetical protein